MKTFLTGSLITAVSREGGEILFSKLPAYLDTLKPEKGEKNHEPAAVILRERLF